MRTVNVTNKKIFIMSLPIFFELFLQLLVGNIDQIMLSGFSSSVAAIGNANTIINLVIVILTMSAAGGMVAITRYIGSGDERKVKDAVIVTFGLVTAFGLIFTLVLVFAAEPMLRVLNAPEEIIGEASAYTAIVGAGLIIQAIQIAAVAVLRSHSKVKEILICAVIMNVCNIVGNWLLINGVWIFPRLGFVGAAISTDVGKAIGLIITLIYLRKKVPVRIKLSDLKHFPKESFKEIIKIALPTGGESTSYNISQIVILSFVNLFGTAVITAKVYCSMLANVAYLYSTAIAQSTQINIGYMVGAGDYDGVSSRVNRTTLICIAISVSLTVILWATSDFVVGLLNTDPEVLALCKQIMFIEIFLEIGRSVNIVMTRCLATVNDIYVPVGITMAMEWTVAVFLGYIFAVEAGYGLVGLWAAMAADEILRGIFFEIRFARRRWIVGHTQNKKLLPHPLHIRFADVIISLTK